MYGLVLEGIAQYIRHEHGEEVWTKIRKKLQMSAETFSSHQIYNEKLIPQLEAACKEIMKMKSDEMYKAFGEYFIGYICTFGYDTMLKVTGRHLRDFLNGLDNLHEYLKFSYPRMKAPSFRIGEEDEEGLTLYYKSKRKGFFNYVLGQMGQVGLLLYSTEVKVSITACEETSKQSNVVFRLSFDNTAFYEAIKEMTRRRKGRRDVLELLKVESTFFLACFPFHLVFDRNMVILHAGESVCNVMPALTNGRIESHFLLSRPVMDFTFKNICQFQNITFELTTIKDVGKAGEKGKKGAKKAGGSQQKGGIGSKIGGAAGGDDSDAQSGRMKLKGQMKFVSSWDCCIFLCSPIMDNLDKMFDLNLFIADLSMHDVSRDLVLVGAQTSRDLADLLAREQGKGKRLEDSMKRLDDLRKRGDELLYSMIPASVAAKMRSGLSAAELCQTHEASTILFSDIPNFMPMTTRLKPMQVMTLLNTIFSRIDMLIERHKVYKVETVGDVYMVAAGAPEPVKEHGAMIANLALDMNQRVPEIKDPGDESGKDTVHIRIGMHSGPVVTGLVGLKMPRFCFFGDTVNTSARMQTNCEVNKIQISEYAKAMLAGKPYKITTRGTITVKGKGEMKTFYLDKKATDGTVVSPAKVQLQKLNLGASIGEEPAVPAAAPADAPAADTPAAPAAEEVKKVEGDPEAVKLPPIQATG